MTTSFDEQGVRRDATGKFSEKKGAAAEISLGAPLTPAREEALNKVRDGSVTFMMSSRFGGKTVPSHYRIDHRKVPGAPYEWLRANGYIRHDAPSLRGTKVTLTEEGEGRTAYRGA